MSASGGARDSDNHGVSGPTPVLSRWSAEIHWILRSRMSDDRVVAPSARVALVTGVGRRRSIGAGLAVGLARDGWDLALGYWSR